MQKNGIVFSVLGLLFFIKKGIHNLILLWTPYYKLFTLHYSLFIKPSNVVRGHGFTICLINYYLENKKPYSLKTNTICVRCLPVVRVTGLEPVRHTTHAPQTCLSASSSTLALFAEPLSEYYNIT